MRANSMQNPTFSALFFIEGSGGAEGIDFDEVETIAKTLLPANLVQPLQKANVIQREFSG